MISTKQIGARTRLVLAACCLALVSALAVSPLITDDADTVQRGHLQLNTGWQFTRTGSVRLHTLPVNPVLGLTARTELGATFGYQWRDDSRSASGNADGITDLTLATKWQLWHTSDDRFKLSGRFDLKLPTASKSGGLGTGDTDVGGVFISTHCWGRTCLDWNVGYTATDASRSVFGDDHWFLGQSVHHELNKHWTLIGETYALLPQGDKGASVNVHFNGGAQFNLRDNFLLSALIGTAVGRNSPNLTSYLGFTWFF